MKRLLALAISLLLFFTSTNSVVYANENSSISKDSTVTESTADPREEAGAEDQMKDNASEENTNEDSLSAEEIVADDQSIISDSNENTVSNSEASVENNSDKKSEGSSDDELVSEDDKKYDSTNGEDTTDQEGVFSGKGSGTDSDPYIISNSTELDQIRNNLAACYQLNNDIDMTSINWETIGSEQRPFTGKLNGNGHIIKNLTINQKIDFSTLDVDSVFWGLFGSIENSSIEKLGLENVNYTVTADDYTGSRTPFIYVAGISGLVVSSTISQCYVTGNINNTIGSGMFCRSAGIASSVVESSSISDCYFDGDVYAKAYSINTMAGGVSSWLTDSTITNCYVRGTVSGINTTSYAYIGGINASGGGTVKNCVSMLSSLNGTALCCFKDNIANYSSKTNNLKLESDDSKCYQEPTYTDLTWDFSNIWILDESVASYPQLRAFVGINEDTESQSYKVNGLATHYNGSQSYELESSENGSLNVKDPITSEFTVPKDSVYTAQNKIVVKNGGELVINGTLNADEVVIKDNSRLTVNGRLNAKKIILQGGGWFSSCSVLDGFGVINTESIYFKDEAILNLDGQIIASDIFDYDSSSELNNCNCKFFIGNMMLVNKHFNGISLGISTIFYNDPSLVYVPKQANLGEMFVSSKSVFDSMAISPDSTDGIYIISYVTPSSSSKWDYSGNLGENIQSEWAETVLNAYQASLKEEEKTVVSANFGFASASDNKFVASLAIIWMDSIAAQVDTDILSISAHDYDLKFEIHNKEYMLRYTLNSYSVFGYTGALYFGTSESNLHAVGMSASGSIKNFKAAAANYLAKGCVEQYYKFLKGNLPKNTSVTESLIVKSGTQFVAAYLEDVIDDTFFEYYSETEEYKQIKKTFKITDMAIDENIGGLFYLAIKESLESALDTTEDDEAMLISDTSTFVETTESYDISDSVTDDKLKEALIDILGEDSDGNPDFTKQDQITELDLSGLHIENIDGIQNFTNLKTLNLSRNELNDVEPLYTMTSLESLDISCQNISDLIPLYNLTNLKTLDVSDNEITSAEPLSGLTDLTDLNVSYNPLASLKGMASLTKLEKLNAAASELADEDLSELSGLNQLTELNLNSSGVVSLEGLNTNSLKILKVNDNQIEDLNPLAGASGLEQLYVYDNELTSLPDFSSCTSLDKLNLSGNMMLTFDNIATAKTLTDLNVSDCYLVNDDMEYLKELAQLKTMDLSYNDVNDISCLSNLAELESIDISGTDLSRYLPEYLTGENVKLIRNGEEVEVIRNCTHDLTEIPATCISPAVCSICGCYVGEIGTEHFWDEGTITAEATKDGNGTLTFTCKRCGTTKTEELTYDITSQPENISAQPGDTAVFGITADNAVAYQWQYSSDKGTTWEKLEDSSTEGSMIEGTVTDTLTLQVTSSNINYMYRCVVTGEKGNTMYSDSAKINVTIYASGTCGENLTWTLDSVGTLTISGTGAMYNFDYLSSLGYAHYEESTSEAPWLLDLSDNSSHKIIKIVIEEGVTSIGSGAFNGLGDPDTDGSFMYNGYIESIQLPDTLESIGYAAFTWCHGNLLTLPDSVNNCSDAFFSSGFKKLVFGKGLSVLPEVSNTSTEEVVIPEGYTEIPNSMFMFSEIKTISIPNTIQTIGDRAFFDCESLSDITIPSSVTTIGSDAFYGCDSLEHVIINGLIKSTGSGSFWNCKSLKSIELPEGLETISSESFKNCESLESINLPDSVTTIGADAFNGCNSIKSLILPDSVTKINSQAFKNMEQLESITIPVNVDTISSGVGGKECIYNAFGNNPNLTSIEVNPQNTTYCSYDGCIYTKDMSQIIYCPDAKKDIIFSEKLTTVDCLAFCTTSDYTLLKYALENGYFQGDAPETYENAFQYLASETEMYYPVNNTTWTDTVRSDFGGDIIWKTWQPDVTKWKVTIAENSFEYTGKEIKPTVTIDTGSDFNPVENKDYTITYKNNTNAGEATVIITGVGKCAGTYSEDFTIFDNSLTISKQPANVSIGLKHKGIFSITAENAVAYQWQYSKNGTKWYNSTASGAKTDTLTVTVSTTNYKNLYRCKITGVKGEIVYSNTAAVDLISGAKITTQPSSVCVLSGEKAEFTVAADNATAYQWYYSKNGGTSWYKSTASGATAETLTVSVSNSNKNNLYKCKITGKDENIVSSSSVGLVIIAAQPDNSTAVIGETGTFTVKADSNNPIAAYKWYYSKDSGKSWYASTSTGADTETLSVKASSANRANLYRCKVTNSAGLYGWTSSAGFVDSENALRITEQPVSVAAAVGDKVSFSVKAENAASYQWYYSKNGTTWYKSTASGNSTDTLTITVTASTKSNQYRCKVTGADGKTATSNIVNIK